MCCVNFISSAAVRDNGKEVLIHFDGWTEFYDYWTETTSTDIHPVGWHEQCHDHYGDLNPALQIPRGFILSLLQWCTAVFLLYKF
jgi:hypothetical protein